MTLDLTLNAIQIPGLPTFTPIFGTKKPDGISLSTAEVNSNVLMPWTRQRPFVIADTGNSTSTVEANTTIVISDQLPSTGAMSLGNGGYIGVEVLIINNSNYSFNIATVIEVTAGSVVRLVWKGAVWIPILSRFSPSAPANPMGGDMWVVG